MADRSERKLSANFAADIAGYSRLVGQDEEGTVRALREYLAAVNSTIAEHGGRVVDTAGDGILAEFPSAVRAVEAAVAMQLRSEGLDNNVPSQNRLRFRIGVNVGDVIIEDGKIFGDGVNVAARLEQGAQPGDVLISGTAFDNLQGTADLPLDYVGDLHVKNISRPIRTYRVRPKGEFRSWRSALRYGRWGRGVTIGIVVPALALLGTWWMRPSEPARAEPSIAVLPFGNLGGDEGTGRLADGLTEDIITDLSRFREFDVIAQSSTAIYKGKLSDIREIAKALDVHYVLEGSIQRQGEQVRVTAQLIDATTGTHVWSERWDRPAGDVFAVQTEIAEQAASRIGGWGAIPEAESKAARRARPKNLSAYELYLLGQQENDRQTKASVSNAIHLLEQAVAKDPGLARAWVALAWAYSSAATKSIDPEANSRAAMAAAQQAAELDPMDPDAHAALAHILSSKGDFSQAKAEFETALRLNPGDAETLTHYARWASTFGEPERGAEAADRALRLNPNAAVWAYGPISVAYFMAGRYDDAVRSIERRPLDSLSRTGLVLRAAIYAAADRIDDARRATADTLAQYPDLTIETFLNDPGYNDVERGKFTQALRKAGFPACASADALGKLTTPAHLPECPRSTN